jgi:hypothetical protein
MENIELIVGGVASISAAVGVIIGYKSLKLAHDERANLEEINRPYIAQTGAAISENSNGLVQINVNYKSCGARPATSAMHYALAFRDSDSQKVMDEEHNFANDVFGPLTHTISDRTSEKYQTSGKLLFFTGLKYIDPMAGRLYTNQYYMTWAGNGTTLQHSSHADKEKIKRLVYRLAPSYFS